MTQSRDESAHQTGCNPQNEGKGSTRREFAKTLAALAVTPLLRPAIAPAHTGGGHSAPAAGDPLAIILGGTQAQTPEKPLPEAEALAEVARIQYGKNLTDDQMAEIKRSVSGRFRAAEAMKKIKLANGDEPAFIFSANPQ